MHPKVLFLLTYDLLHSMVLRLFVTQKCILCGNLTPKLKWNIATELTNYYHFFMKNWDRNSTFKRLLLQGNTFSYLFGRNWFFNDGNIQFWIISLKEWDHVPLDKLKAPKITFIWSFQNETTVPFKMNTTDALSISPLPSHLVAHHLNPSTQHLWLCPRALPQVAAVPCAWGTREKALPWAALNQ